ncbi:MAG: redoxin domain-containing protein [Candidatus Aminicenantes bacterium]|nr:redoxin domain-containing protein [Candidatus Aminicenantes bacterium]
MMAFGRFRSRVVVWTSILWIFWGYGSGPSELNLTSLSGERVDPFAAVDSPSVFLFLRSDCPISNRYAPELRRLHEAFSPRGVRFWLVYVDPQEEAGSIRRHAGEFQLPGEILRDSGHDLVRLTGARVTPEAAVFDAGGRLVYRGRIDDRYTDFGKARARPNRRDLMLALESVLQGEPVAEPVTPAVGCFIADLAGR